MSSVIMQAPQLTAILLFLALLCSCAGIEVDPYNDSKMASFKLTQELEQKIAVTISSNHDINKISCRGIMSRGGIDIHMPQGQTYAEYIQTAFIKTLAAANKYDATAKTILKGNISKIDFDTIAGNWHLAGKFNIANKNFSIDKSYSFPTSWEPQTACNNAATFFSAAVTQFLLDALEEAL